MAQIYSGSRARIAMSAKRRLWDSSIVIGYLAGQEDLAEACHNIIEMAKRGEAQVIVSAIATIEVAYLQGSDDQESEAKIQELFSREYIIPAAIDIGVARIARGLVRKYRAGPKIKPPDAAHLATAIQLRIPVVETTDPDLLKLDGCEGNPPIAIRRPLYEGTMRMPGME